MAKNRRRKFVPKIYRRKTKRINTKDLDSTSKNDIIETLSRKYSLCDMIQDKVSKSSKSKSWMSDWRRRKFVAKIYQRKIETRRTRNKVEYFRMCKNYDPTSKITISSKYKARNGMTPEQLMKRRIQGIWHEINSQGQSPHPDFLKKKLLELSEVQSARVSNRIKLGTRYQKLAEEKVDPIDELIEQHGASLYSYKFFDAFDKYDRDLYLGGNIELYYHQYRVRRLDDFPTMGVPGFNYRLIKPHYRLMSEADYLYVFKRDPGIIQKCHEWLSRASKELDRLRLEPFSETYATLRADFVKVNTKLNDLSMFQAERMKSKL